MSDSTKTCHIYFKFKFGEKFKYATKCISFAKSKESLQFVSYVWQTQNRYIRPSTPFLHLKYSKPLFNCNYLISFKLRKSRYFCVYRSTFHAYRLPIFFSICNVRSISIVVLLHLSMYINCQYKASLSKAFCL